MKKIKIITPILTLFILSVLFYGCHKTSATDPCANDGSGGSLTVVAYPQHHGKAIYNLAHYHDAAWSWLTVNDTINYADTVYIKYNTQDAPAIDANGKPTNADIYFVGEPGENHVHCKNLKCGKYYVYATGWDTVLHLKVHGGIGLSTTQTSGQLDNFLVPVSE